MLSTVLEYHSTGLECFLEGWNAFYRVGKLCTELENVLQSWNAPYRVGIHSTELEYSLQS
jgi:hypothetical protein